MAEEKKKKIIDYKKVAENSLTRKGGWLKDVYERLSQMQEADIQARISEIIEAMELVDINTARMQRRATSQDRKRRVNQLISEGKIDPKKEKIIPSENVSDEEKAKTEASLEELSFIGTQLENEVEMLEYFPKVRATIKAIEDAKAHAQQEEVTLTGAIAVAEEELAEAEEKAKKAIENAEKAKQIDEEIAELEKEMEEAKAKGRKQTIIDGYLEEIDDKRGEKAELGTEEEWKESRDGVEESKKKIKSLKSGQKRIGKAIEKCSNPWETMLRKFSWVEIGELKSRELSKMIGTEVEKDEKAGWQEKPKGKDKDKKEKEGKGAALRGGDYIPPAPAKPDEEPEKPEEESELEDDLEPDDEHDTSDNNVPKKTWFAKIPFIAKWMENRARRIEDREDRKLAKKLAKETKNIMKQAKKEEAEARVQAFIEKFRAENKGEPSWWQKFKVRYFGEKDDDRRDPPAPPSGGRKGEAVEVSSPEPAEPEAPVQAEPDKDAPVAEADKTRADILNEVTKLSLAQIEERIADLERTLTDKDIEFVRKIASEREQYAKQEPVMRSMYEEKRNGGKKKRRKKETEEQNLLMLQ